MNVLCVTIGVFNEMKLNKLVEDSKEEKYHSRRSIAKKMTGFSMRINAIVKF